MVPHTKYYNNIYRKHICGLIQEQLKIVPLDICVLNIITNIIVYVNIVCHKFFCENKCIVQVLIKKRLNMHVH